MKILAISIFLSMCLGVPMEKGGDIQSIATLPQLDTPSSSSDLNHDASASICLGMDNLAINDEAVAHSACITDLNASFVNMTVKGTVYKFRPQAVSNLYYRLRMNNISRFSAVDFASEDTDALLKTLAAEETKEPAIVRFHLGVLFLRMLIEVHGIIETLYASDNQFIRANLDSMSPPVMETLRGIARTKGLHMYQDYVRIFRMMYNSLIAMRSSFLEMSHEALQNNVLIYDDISSEIASCLHDIVKSQQDLLAFLKKYPIYMEAENMLPLNAALFRVYAKSPLAASDNLFRPESMDELKEFMKRDIKNTQFDCYNFYVRYMHVRDVVDTLEEIVIPDLESPMNNITLLLSKKNHKNQVKLNFRETTIAFSLWKEIFSVINGLDKIFLEYENLFDRGHCIILHAEEFDEYRNLAKSYLKMISKACQLFLVDSHKKFLGITSEEVSVLKDWSKAYKLQK